jgi:uncharacterized membrane protein YhaH (DUF805 family)
MGSTSYAELLFSFKGRIQRLYFWVPSLVVGVIVGMLTTSLQFWAQQVGSGAIDPDTQQFEPSGPFAIGIGIIAILNMWINFALCTKRLHDRDRTGWWLVVQFLTLSVTVIILVVAILMQEDQRVPWFVVAGVGGAVSFVVSIWLFIEIGFLRGTQGPNRFGADPLGAAKPDANL